MTVDEIIVTPPPAPAGDSPISGNRDPQQQLDALTNDLTTLRERVAAVDYRAAVLRLLVGANDQRHLDIASEDLDVALTAFRGTADMVVERSSTTAALWGVRPAERTLAVLAERAPEQWRQDLREQTKALAAETARLRERLTSDTGLVNSSQRQLSATLQLLVGDDETPVTYEPPGRNQAHLIDHLA